MYEEYNLITEPWILCLDLSGKKRKYSLLEVLGQAHQLDGLLSMAPVVKASLYRLLLVILGRVFGPHDMTEWVQIQQAGAFDRQKIGSYFSRWEHRFNLFDDKRPFYQVADRRVKPKMLLKMVPHLSSGNNATLFDHSTEVCGVTMEPDEAACYLVALQYYGLGGLTGIEEKFTSAPPCRGISFFVQGKNLFDTLLLNMICIGDDNLHAIPTSDPERDIPCWEMEDPYQPRKIPYGLFDYLTWQNRHVLLYPELENGHLVVRKMTEAPGMRLDDKFITGTTIRDPYQYYYQGSSDPTELRFHEERAVWRDSAVLLNFTDDQTHLLAPPNLIWLHMLSKRGKLEKKATYQLNALGMAADKAKVLFYGDENLPLPAPYLEDIDLVSDLQNALSKAEALSKTLFSAISRMAEIIISFDCDLKGSKPDAKMVDALRNHLRGDPVFWSGLENGFYVLIKNIPIERKKALAEWDKLLHDQTWHALEYSQRMAGDDLRAQKAAVSAGAIVGGGIKKILNIQREEVLNE